MKKFTKSLVLTAVMIVIVVCSAFSLTACNNFLDQLAETKLDAYASALETVMLGNDAFNWNAYSIDPENSFGYQKDGSYQWYSYTPTTSDEINEMKSAFSEIADAVNGIQVRRLKGNRVNTFYALQSTVDSFNELFSSPYAVQFSLLNGDYISSQGGYVADFTTCVENFVFRKKSDVDGLLEVIDSTKDAFMTYTDYVKDRKTANFPLYAVTISEQIDYLNAITEEGDNYYLYTFLNNRIDEAECLSAAEKTSYKESYHSAVKDKFMEGVKNLSTGLEAYKNDAPTEVTKSYLAMNKEVGQAFYKWKFTKLTGIKNPDMNSVMQEVNTAYTTHAGEAFSVIQTVNGLQTSKPQVYKDFSDYVVGKKFILNLTSPDDMLVYLKEAAKSIVPNLTSTPEIDFKYMDATVAGRSTAMAYYLLSPLDEENSKEHITINPNYVPKTDGSDSDDGEEEESNNYSPLLLTIAHEGYPGHLYAHVNAKEGGNSAMSFLGSSTAFSEGWAMYTELALLDVIKAQNPTDEALNYYCTYLYHETLANYLSNLYIDLLINYLGGDLNLLAYAFPDASQEKIQSIINFFMEVPVVYVSYGYGAYYMLDLHTQAKEALGDKYNEVSFNGELLSHGTAPTLPRAKAIVDAYVLANK